jgi:type I restriction enzyme R subunit
MPDKEATARIKINKLLEAAGWRFFADGSAPANIRLEPRVTIKSTDLDALGANFEKSTKGFVDFLLLDAKGFPLLVLEAKGEGKNPLVGKEQARKYAKSQNCRFVILSNGNLHYFWDLERGSPYVITSFPTPDSVAGYQKVTPNPQRLIEEQVGEDYIVRTQRPNYAAEAAWQNEAERPGYIQANKLRFLRPYQLKAIHSLQAAVGDGKDRFLFEMATGTGKTLTAAAVIKLFLRSGNVRRVLFLVDRLELEDQAKKSFNDVLSADYQTVIYKENRDDWRRAEIVVTTVQSLLFNNKYQKLFSPTDFDLVISDEAHRSIGGNARAVFDYFIGYKLGLTATPRDYLRRFDGAKPGTRDPREAERRLLLDTYRTFGCENSQPTFRYSLLDGVKEGFLINPTVVDARTEVTTTLLSEEGFVVSFTDDTGEDQQQAFKQREFEKRFFADTTNQLLCKTFLENALRDPVSGEIGKSIIFAVSQNHAAKLAQILNQMARPHVSGQVPVRLCRAGHLPDTRRPAVHHQLRQQQPARLRQLHPHLQDQQGAHLRHRWHDDHRLRLHRHPQHRSVPPDLLAHRLHPDQGTRHPQARLPRGAFRRHHQGRRATAHKDRVQTLRLLRQLRILRGRF